MPAASPNSERGISLPMPRAVYAGLRAHAEETYPHECCGVLLGSSVEQSWKVVAAVRACNARTAAAHNRYEIAPAELVAIQREALRRGLEIAGFYHSHPDYPAQWSATDLAEAHWVGCCYVITQVAQGKAEATHAFLLSGLTEEDKHFEAATIVLAE